MVSVWVMTTGFDDFEAAIRTGVVTGTFRLSGHILTYEFEGITFRRCRIVEGDFSGSAFKKCRFEDVVFAQSKLMNVTFDRSRFECLALENTTVGAFYARPPDE